jgi:hypothetical protein
VQRAWIRPIVLFPPRRLHTTGDLGRVSGWGGAQAENDPVRAVLVVHRQQWSMAAIPSLPGRIRAINEEFGWSEFRA